MIAASLGFTKNKIKKSLQVYRAGNLQNSFIENRGAHKKNGIFISNEVEQFMCSWVENSQHNFSISDIHKEIRRRFLDISVSRSTVFRAFTSKLGQKFVRLSKHHHLKNSLQNVGYRFKFVHELMRFLSEGTTVISIDETSLSSYSTTYLGWTGKDRKKYNIKESLSGGTNITLLLASSQSSIVGYYFVKGAVDSVVYLSFFIELVNSLKANRIDVTSQIVFLMDNVRIHNNSQLMSFYSKEKLRLLFTPKYSPEVNFIEHVFARIK